MRIGARLRASVGPSRAVRTPRVPARIAQVLSNRAQSDELRCAPAVLRFCNAISNHRGRRREVARQTDLLAKALGGQLFVSRPLAMISCNAEKVAHQAIALVGRPRTSGRLGGFNCVAKPSSTRTGEWSGGLSPRPCFENCAFRQAV